MKFECSLVYWQNKWFEQKLVITCTKMIIRELTMWSHRDSSSFKCIKIWNFAQKLNKYEFRWEVFLMWWQKCIKNVEDWIIKRILMKRTNLLSGFPTGLLVLIPSVWVRLAQLQGPALIDSWRAWGVKSSGSKVSWQNLIMSLKVCSGQRPVQNTSWNSFKFQRSLI